MARPHYTLRARLWPGWKLPFDASGASVGPKRARNESKS